MKSELRMHRALMDIFLSVVDPYPYEWAAHFYSRTPFDGWHVIFAIAPRTSGRDLLQRFKELCLQKCGGWLSFEPFDTDPDTAAVRVTFPDGLRFDEPVSAE